MLRIAIVSDESSWMAEYIPALKTELETLGNVVTWIHDVARIPSGDIAFILGCSRLISTEGLARNTHNVVVHESALPEGRGWSPLSWQILTGKNDIPITLFEATSEVDAGPIYLQEMMRFDGSELIDELRRKQGEFTIRLCLEFAQNLPGVLSHAKDQQGRPTHYTRRRPEDSRLDPDRTIREQFNLLRIVDNSRYPAFFELDGERYVLSIRRSESK